MLRNNPELSLAAPPIIEALLAVKAATEAKALQASKQAWAREQEAAAALTSNNVVSGTDSNASPKYTP